jgi:hypothetical protein
MVTVCCTNCCCLHLMKQEMVNCDSWIMGGGGDTRSSLLVVLHWHKCGLVMVESSIY